MKKLCMLFLSLLLVLTGCQASGGTVPLLPDVRWGDSSQKVFERLQITPEGPGISEDKVAAIYGANSLRLADIPFEEVSFTFYENELENANTGLAWFTAQFADEELEKVTAVLESAFGSKMHTIDGMQQISGKTVKEACGEQYDAFSLRMTAIWKELRGEPLPDYVLERETEDEFYASQMEELAGKPICAAALRKAEDGVWHLKISGYSAAVLENITR